MRGGSTESSAYAASTASSTVRNVALPNNGYGAYWGTYNNTPAFFQSNGALFAQQAKGVIDVSQWQGDINWDAVKASGNVQGVIVRIGYGSGNALDTKAARNISALKRLGIPFGVYWYSYSENASVSVEEANSTADALRQLGVSASDLSYPVYYDMERWTWTGHSPSTDPNVNAAAMHAYFNTLSARGYGNTAVYSYTSYLNSALKHNDIWQRTTWVAQYGARMGFSAWNTNFRGWQYSSSGQVSGISGNVDINAFGNYQYVDNDPAGTDPSRYGNLDNSVADGEYYIKTASANKYLASSGASAENGADIVLWDFAETSNQRFKIKKSSTNQYTISVMNSGKVLDAKGGSDRSGTNVIQWDNLNASNQQWKFYKTSDGSYIIESVLGDSKNRVIDIPNGNMSNWVNLILWGANGGANQKFQLIPVSDHKSGANGWVTTGGKTYYYRNGFKLKGENFLGGSWYLFDSVTGARLSGWQRLSSNGGKTVYYDASGRMVKGELFIGGSWYLFDSVTGARLSGWQRLSSNGGKTVYYDASGRMVKGELFIGGSWYLFDSVTGARLSGWQRLSSNGGKTVYYDASGRMVKGELFIGGSWYLFDSVTGARLSGWQRLSSNGGKTVYYDASGRMVKGELFIGGSWYLFDSVTGARLSGWQRLSSNGGKTVYYDASGKMLKGRQIIDNRSYYFDEITGALVR